LYQVIFTTHWDVPPKDYLVISSATRCHEELAKYLLPVIVLSCWRFSAVFLSSGKFWDSVLKVTSL